jgi:hypothetical protein
MDVVTVQRLTVQKASGLADYDIPIIRVINIAARFLLVRGVGFGQVLIGGGRVAISVLNGKPLWLSFIAKTTSWRWIRLFFAVYSRF